ncbi:Arylsulfatase precursor [Planctomycetes bacterium MalM25]|nr:Arylsulfatase precursor [Planctomycetes bacterium MalM25]
MTCTKSAVFLLLITATSYGAADPMNVVFILADDLGWSDTTLFGTTSYYETPQIERLSQRGMTFTRAYASSPLCSPTRASILTGLAPARHGITSPNCHLPQVTLKATADKRAPADQHATTVNTINRLVTEYDTLPERLRDEGYRTGHFGKWHLGLEPYSPLEHGFDIDVPHWPGPGPAGSYVAPWRYPDFDPQTPNEHIEDRMAEEAVAFMTAECDQPFFLNYWMFSVHAPFDAKPDLIEKYRARTDPASPQRCPTYAAMIESMDDAVGTLLDAIDSLGIADRTIIVFASDNGGNMYNVVEGVAPTSNAPLRGGKATMYEGGVRGPCIVVWPGVTTPGTETDTPISSYDYYPTLLQMLGLKAHSRQKFDGVSFADVLKGAIDTAGVGPSRPLFTYFPHCPKVPDWLPPSASVLRDEWKLIRLFYAGGEGEHRWKLFNLREDPGERRDLTAERPELVAELDALIEQHLKESDAVLPARNPAFAPDEYDQAAEGVSRMNRKKRKQPPTAPVAGWQAVNDCRLKLADGLLTIASVGSDPYLKFKLPKQLPAGTYCLELELRVDGPADVEVYWREGKAKPAFAAGRSVALGRVPEGSGTTFRGEIKAAKPITELRLDPSRMPGTTTLRRLSLVDEDGTLLPIWTAQ